MELRWVPLCGGLYLLTSVPAVEETGPVREPEHPFRPQQREALAGRAVRRSSGALCLLCFNNRGLGPPEAGGRCADASKTVSKETGIPWQMLLANEMQGCFFVCLCTKYSTDVLECHGPLQIANPSIARQGLDQQSRHDHFLLRIVASFAILRV